MNSRFPLRIIVFAAILTIVAMLSAIAILYFNSRSAASNEQNRLALQAVSAEILLYDEQLTSSALLGAYSGDVKWAERYLSVEQQLLDALDIAHSLGNTPEIRAAAKSTVHANNILVDLEYQAFDAVRAGKQQDALALLMNPTYKQNKQRYTTGMETVHSLMRDKRVADQIASKRRFRNVVAMVLVFFTFTSLLWLQVYKIISNWSTRFLEEAKRRADAELKLHELNEKLEFRIEDRTYQLRESQEKLIEQANTDDLTGLPNRRFVMEHLRTVLVNRKAEELVYVMLLDLDHFKRINDTLGHSAGDELLIEAAKRLQESVGDEDVVARLGGDEFLIVSADICDGSAKTQQNMNVETILERFSTPFSFQRKLYNLPVSPSIGIAVAPEDGSDAGELMRNADTAMYAAKDDGRNSACFYIPEMNIRNNERIAMEQKLRSAISSNDQFKLHYQPQIELASNRIVGVEALLRWEQPEDGMIPPDRFIPLAEDTGLIIDIGQWVLFEAARQIREWQDNNDVDLIMSINVASQQLKQGGFLEKLMHVLQEHGTHWERFGVEITESCLIGNDAVTRGNIDGLKDLGIKLSLDDFGTGYSALSYLKQYPFDYLKIDRSFIGNILEADSNAALVEGIINMSRNIDLKVVSEGTETEEQCALLRSFGCDIAQGYYYSKPLPANELIDFVARWSDWLQRESRLTGVGS